MAALRSTRQHAPSGAPKIALTIVGLRELFSSVSRCLAAKRVHQS